MDKNCLHCGELFKTTPSQIKAGYGKFCCKQCAYDYKYIKTHIKVVCKHCNKVFIVPQSRLNYERDNTNYCSKACMNQHRSKDKKLCVDCGKVLSKQSAIRCLSCNRIGERSLTFKGGDIKTTCEFCGITFNKDRSQYAKSKYHYCSPECCNTHRRTLYVGLNSTGKTKLSYLLRTNAYNREWRTNVFKRDNYTCQRCGERGSYIEAHHIVELTKLVKKYNIISVVDAIKIKEFWDIDNGITLCKSCHKQEHKDRRKLDATL